MQWHKYISLHLSIFTFSHNQNVYNSEFQYHRINFCLYDQVDVITCNSFHNLILLFLWSSWYSNLQLILIPFWGYFAYQSKLVHDIFYFEPGKYRAITLCLLVTCSWEVYLKVWQRLEIFLTLALFRDFLMWHC